MGDRSDLNILIFFSKDGTTFARMSKISGFGTTASAKLLRTGTAKCHPDDKFDPQIGAMIAMARMFGDEVEYHSEEPERKLTDFEKDALEKGYTLVRDRLPSCTAYDGRYLVMDKNGGSGGGLHWDHKGKTFTISEPDHMKDCDRICAHRIWMESPDSVIAWKAQPDAVEQKALDDGYTLCRDRYPDKSGKYDIITEYGGRCKNVPWSSRWKTFGAGDDSKKSTANMGILACMTKGHDPVIAWTDGKIETVIVRELVRCKDCKHRPTGDDLEFPDDECPCQCEDFGYNWKPADEWYCGNGERKDGDHHDAV